MLRNLQNPFQTRHYPLPSKIMQIRVIINIIRKDSRKFCYYYQVFTLLLTFLLIRHFQLVQHDIYCLLLIISYLNNHQQIMIHMLLAFIQDIRVIFFRHI